MDSKKMKKDLQKIVKAYMDSKPDIQDWRGNPCRDEYPKAMMTSQQMLKQTATINFGYDKAAHQAELKEFRSSEAFQSFLKQYELTDAGQELNQDNNIQIRIRW